MSDLIQFTFSGLTVGAIYALVALGFTLIYNASDVINFAQGEFVMLGGMVTVFAVQAGMPMPAAALIAVVVAIVAGLALYRFAVAPAGDASAVVLVIITIGASIALRGAAQVLFGENVHTLAPLLGSKSVEIDGATIQPQSLIVLLGTILLVAVLWIFLERTLLGKAVRATAANRTAARLVGINTGRIVALSFAISAAVGAVAGILITPITLTSYDIGTFLALKGFAGAMLGGMGNPAGAVLGGLIVGLLEAFGAGYVSSAYKDAVAFLIILGVLFAMPQGILGRARTERV